MIYGVNGNLDTYYLEHNGNSGVHITIRYQEEYNVAEKYSIIKIPYIGITCDMFEESTECLLSGTISIDGVEQNFSGFITVEDYTEHEHKCSIQSDKIYHNGDGLKSITVTLKVASWTNSKKGIYLENTGTLSTKTFSLIDVSTADKNPLNCIHTWNMVVMTENPTYHSNGVKTYTCSKCGSTCSLPVSRLGSISQLVPTVSIYDLDREKKYIPYVYDASAGTWRKYIAYISENSSFNPYY